MEDEIVDIEAMGLTVDGMTVEQIMQLKSFYQKTTHDMDLERLWFYTKT